MSDLTIDKLTQNLIDKEKRDMLAKIEIPAGWTKEIYPGTDTTVVISTPEGIHVTVDFKARWWSLGHGVSHLVSGPGLSSKGTKYAGRSWRQDIIWDAVQALQAI